MVEPVSWGGDAWAAPVWTLDFGLWTLDFRLVGMSKKSGHIAARIESFQGQALDAHYLGYFDCFNRQLFYEAHDVLEELWLPDRHGLDGDFYKGLIQLAGAFVHIQKNRRGPAAALFRLAQTNLGKYPARHHQLELSAVAELIRGWVGRLDEPGEVIEILQRHGPPGLKVVAG